MRTLVDIPEKQLAELTKIADAKKTSRAAVLREAVSKYLESNRPISRKKAIDKAFGIWKDLKIDSVEYQRKLRDEW
jgi:metal-responsive CopG/Arc/MetJ family transcriptional regulator